jgi:hypothetical protein
MKTFIDILSHILALVVIFSPVIFLAIRFKIKNLGKPLIEYTGPIAKADRVINPATGLRMVGNTDTWGNPYGTDLEKP